MARKLTQYICEICGARYQKESEAEKCEKAHYTPVEIGTFDYDTSDNKKQYPLKIRIKVKNGEGAEKSIEYTRKLI